MGGELHLAARAATVYDFSSFPKLLWKEKQITSLNGSLIFSENAIEITSGKAFRLFSEHQKRFISSNSSLSKEKKQEEADHY